MNIKTRILLVVFLLELFGYGLLITLNQNTSSKALSDIKNKQIHATFDAGLQKLNNQTKVLEQQVLSVSNIGQQFYRQLSLFPKEQLTQQLQIQLIQLFEQYSDAIGGGIWFEPNIIQQQKFFGPYVFRENNQVKFSWDLSTQAYDYHNQSWYQLALPSGWPRSIQRPQNIYWTEPYKDEAGSEQLMMTVDSFIWDDKKTIIGLATVDWALTEITDFFSQIKVTPKSNSFLIDGHSGKIIFSSANPELTMKQATETDWGKIALTETLPNELNMIDLTEQSTSDKVAFAITSSGIIFGVTIPYTDLVAETKYAEQQNLWLGILISATFIALVSLSLQQIFKPFNRVISLVKDSIKTDHRTDELTVSKIKYSGKNEFSPLIKALNKLFNEFKNYTKQIEQTNKNLILNKKEITNLNEDLHSKVEELTELHNELENNSDRLTRQNLALNIAIKKANNAVESKSNFLALMSHEIRTPLNGILGMVSLLKTSSLDKNQSDSISVIEQSGNTLLTIIDDILDISKIEAGKLHLSSHKFDFEEVCYQCLELIQARMLQQEKSIDIIFDYPISQTFELYADDVRLRQILLNLLGNALKFTRQGNITLKVNITNTLRVEVIDTGIGIEIQNQANLFDTFSQADQMISKKYGGTGLGLAICKKLISQMQGDIGVISAINHGSTFWFEIPITSINSQLIETPKTHNKLIIRANNHALKETLMMNLKSHLLVSSADSLSPTQDTSILNINDTTTEAQLQLSNDTELSLKKPIRPREIINKLITAGINTSVTSNTNTTTENLSYNPIFGHVLVVEDNLINLAICQNMLEKFGLSHDFAINGKVAVEKAENNHYDLILMDCRMPELDGFQATKLIRKLPHLDKIPILALSANVLAEDVEKCLLAGMNEHIAKPITLSILYERLSNYLSKQKDVIKLA